MELYNTHCFCHAYTLQRFTYDRYNFAVYRIFADKYSAVMFEL